MSVPSSSPRPGACPSCGCEEPPFDGHRQCVERTTREVARQTAALRQRAEFLEQVLSDTARGALREREGRQLPDWLDKACRIAGVTP